MEGKLQKCEDEEVRSHVWFTKVRDGAEDTGDHLEDALNKARDALITAYASPPSSQLAAKPP